MARRVAAIFAHPDDEVLGCGGALALHAARGDVVRTLILATGQAARGSSQKAAIARLQDQGRRACNVLGGTEIEFANLPDNAMDTVALLEIVRRVETFLAEFPAATIYTHHGGDLNVDHRLTHQAVVTACRPLPDAPDRAVLACEVPSSTEWAPPHFAPFTPTEFIDIEATLEKKVKALQTYRDEIRKRPHPRSPDGVRALAHWRGSQCGRAAAEAFIIVRRVGNIV